MGSEETRWAVVDMLSKLIQEGSLLAPHVADELAGKAVEKLLEGEYLIASGRVYTVHAADFDGTTHEYVGGPWDNWHVLTHPEPEES